MIENSTIFRSERVTLYSCGSAFDGAINAGKDTAECVHPYLLGLGDRDLTLLDIGANVGATAVLLARALPRLQVVAYEPQPELYKALCANVALHKLRNVECVQRAVGDFSFIDALTAYDNTGMSKARHSPGPRSLPIESDSLDAVFTSRSLGRCDVLKMDVEGAEYDILSKFTLWDRVGKFHLEVHEPLLPLDEIKRLGMYDHHFGPGTGLQRYIIDKLGLSYLNRHARMW